MTIAGCDHVLRLLSIAFVAFVASSPAASVDMSTAALMRVDQSGNGDYTRIQDAVDAVPSNNTALVYILVKPGTYREKIVIPADKPFITLSGMSANETIISWSEGWTSLDAATVSVYASDFVARYLTIENTFGRSAPAIAMQVQGDRAAFYACRFLSYQDTILDHSGRHYYSNCYIEGATDFICGNGQSLFEKCHIHSISKDSGAITAQRRSTPDESTGYSFVNCKVTGTGAAVLGRPWGPYSRVVFARTYMSSAVLPQGWDDWNVPSNQRTVYYGQYKCSGPGSRTSSRVEWSYELSDTEALQFTSQSWIGGLEWLRPLPTKFRNASGMLN